MNTYYKTLAASILWLVASCTSYPTVTSSNPKYQKIAGYSACATMFSYAAEFGLPREKELFLKKFRYMMDSLISALGDSNELYQFAEEGNRLIMNNAILKRQFDGGLKYNGAMVFCEKIYDELIKTKQPHHIQTATTNMSAVQVFELVKPSVWTVISFNMRSGKPDWEGAMQGSAVAISRNSLLTNCHTLKGNSRYVIAQPNVPYIYVDIASADYVSDRCVLHASNGILEKYVDIRPSSSIDVGEEAYSIGGPSGLELTMANGIVSGKRIIKGVPYLQTTAPISRGSSGGGLFDRSGRLMGITTFYLAGGQNLNFAIAADQF